MVGAVNPKIALITTTAMQKSPSKQPATQTSKNTPTQEESPSKKTWAPKKKKIVKKQRAGKLKPNKNLFPTRDGRHVRDLTGHTVMGAPVQPTDRIVLTTDQELQAISQAWARGGEEERNRVMRAMGWHC